MTKILVVHGAGMNMRGKVQVDIFGPMKLPEYDAQIRKYAGALDLEIEIFHSNIEGEVINKFYDAQERGIDAAVFNPAGFVMGYPALGAAIEQVSFPTIEVHISNPAKRGRVSEISRACRGVIVGVGIVGYDLALRAAKEIAAKK